MDSTGESCLIFQQNGLAATPLELIEPEEDALSALGGVSMVWTGRAATALYCAYRIARYVGEPVEEPEVIFPATSCVSPAACALSAGCRIRFADVDPRTGMLTLDTVCERWTPATRAVVFIHLYGQTAELQELAHWCQARNILLIEDLAQAHGAKFPNGRLAGMIGDMVVYSFNRTKILECGGGALMLRSQRLADGWRELASMEMFSPELAPQTGALLALSQRNLYQSLIAARRMLVVTDISSAFLSVQHAYSGLYIRSLNDAAALAAAWKTLPAQLEERARKAEVYSSRLDGGPWKLLDGWRVSGVCWRYSLLLNFPRTAVSFTEAVRSDGFHVSNLYWPLNDLLNRQDACPHAEEFGRRIINLWVDDSVDVDWVARCADSVCGHGMRHNISA
jgi:dTDP-4-amino-4,6-dideoxygalactose transaminase